MDHQNLNFLDTLTGLICQNATQQIPSTIQPSTVHQMNVPVPMVNNPSNILENLEEWIANNLPAAPNMW